MKSFCLILIMVSACFTACKKTKVVASDPFQGGWTVKKYMSEPGNASASYVDAGSPIGTITFYSANKLAWSSTSYFGLQLLESYQVIDDTQIRFFFKPVSSQSATTYRYKFSGDTLILNPPCISGCGLKLVRAKAYSL